MNKLSAFSSQLSAFGQPRFRKMVIWIKSMEFVEMIYQATNQFPLREMYGLTNQLRRSAISIALNIAEGSGAGSDKEFNRFLNISLRSSYEIVCGIEVANRLRYCEDQKARLLLSKVDEISAMISGFKKKLK